MKKLFFVIAALAAIVGCTDNDDSVINEPANGSSDMKVTALVKERNSKIIDTYTIGTSVKQDGFDKGPVVGTSFAPSSEIGLVVYSANSFNAYPGGQNNENLKWVFNSSAWQYYIDGEAATKQFAFANSLADVYAYFPYSGAESASASSNSQVYSISNINPGYTDYMYGKSTGHNFKNPNVNLLMQHAMALVSFTFTKDGYSGPSQVNSITLNNLPSSATMKLDSGIPQQVSVGSTNLSLKGFVNGAYQENSVWGNSGNSANYNFANGTIGSADVTSDSAPTIPLFHAIVLPQTSDALKNLNSIGNGESSTIFATVVIDNLTLDVPLTLASGWQAGKIHTYNLKMKGNNELVVSSVVVNQWQDGGSADIEI